MTGECGDGTVETDNEDGFVLERHGTRVTCIHLVLGTVCAGRWCGQWCSAHQPHGASRRACLQSPDTLLCCRCEAVRNGSATTLAEGDGMIHSSMGMNCHALCDCRHSVPLAIRMISGYRTFLMMLVTWRCMAVSCVADWRSRLGA
jgi:hypothetical protein